ncbi:MAG TPA: hypothetical protein ENI23_15865 [bacterium]|nr:hypothetical protein [bacterium]
MRIKLSKILRLGFLTFLIVSFSFQKVSAQEEKASIYLSPSQGTFEVGGTFDASFFVSTGEEDVTEIGMDISFPSDKLQLVESNLEGGSFVETWISPPQVDNVNGTSSLQGEVAPPGINTTSGLIIKYTFRVKAPGEAIINVLSTSSVLANNGEKTDILSFYGRGVFQLDLAASGGPIITSNTHEDINRWYRDNNPNLSWSVQNSESGQSRGSSEYSWSFDQDSQGVPDNEIDGVQTSASYEDIKSGIWYFHVKARTDGVWTKTSHYSVRIDNSAPLSFVPAVEITEEGGGNSYLISYSTTDKHSGVDYYDVKLERIRSADEENATFIEEPGPWQLSELEPGRHRVIVRAYDKAGNWSEAEVIFNTNQGLFGGGVVLGTLFIPWWLLLFLLVVLAPSLVILYRFAGRTMGDPSSQIAKYVNSIQNRLGRSRAKLRANIEEEKEIEGVLQHELSKHSHEKSNTTKKKEEY